MQKMTMAPEQPYSMMPVLCAGRTDLHRPPPAQSGGYYLGDYRMTALKNPVPKRSSVKLTAEQAAAIRVWRHPEHFHAKSGR